jgi:hypothetical protein
MADEWIKMRHCLRETPEVIRVAIDLNCEEDLVVGKLHRLWSWADQQTADGYITGVTETWVDRYVQMSGFAASLRAAGWLESDAKGMLFPNFDRHNGQSAKRRALDADRKRRSRKPL